MRSVTGNWTSRVVVLLVAVFLVPGCERGAAQEVPWPTSGWARSSPESQGLDGAPLVALHEATVSGTYGYIDRLVVVRSGYLVVSERYGNDYEIISRGSQGPLGCGAATCRDESASHEYNYYHPTTHPYYQGRDVHSLQSVTKSVSATVIGIALERGAIDGVHVPLLTFFEDYDLSRVDDRLRGATLADLLTMRSGIEWHENDRPLDETNTTLMLERSEDWIQFTLDQPTDAAPAGAFELRHHRAACSARSCGITSAAMCSNFGIWSASDG